MGLAPDCGGLIMFWDLGRLGGPRRSKDDTGFVGWGILPFLKLLWLLHPLLWATLFFLLPGFWEAEAGLDLHMGLFSVLLGDALQPQGLPLLPSPSLVPPQPGQAEHVFSLTP